MENSVQSWHRRTPPDPLIKSQFRRRPERDINKKNPIVPTFTPWVLGNGSCLFCSGSGTEQAQPRTLKTGTTLGCRRHLPILISANPDHWLGRLAPVFNARKRNIFIILAHWALQSEPDMSGLDHTASAYQMLGLVLRSVRRYYENVLFPSMHSKIDVKRMSNLISIQGETV
jgi:hypothetical protein